MALETILENFFKLNQPNYKCYNSNFELNFAGRFDDENGLK